MILQHFYLEFSLFEHLFSSVRVIYYVRQSERRAYYFVIPGRRTMSINEFESFFVGVLDIIFIFSINLSFQ